MPFPGRSLGRVNPCPGRTVARCHADPGALTKQWALDIDCILAGVLRPITDIASLAIGRYSGGAYV